MADEIQRIQYFYTEVADKPGEGTKVLAAVNESRPRGGRLVVAR